MRMSVIALACLLGTGAAQAQDYKLGALGIDHPWARPASSANGAAYLTIRNEGTAPDRLIGIEAGIGRKAEMHTTRIDANGVASMTPLPALDVPAKGEAGFTPAGNHIMLLGLKAPLREGERFPMTLTFEKAGSVRVEVLVEKGGADHGHDQMTMPMGN